MSKSAVGRKYLQFFIIVCFPQSATMVLVGMMMGKMPSIPTHAVAMKGLRIQGIFTGSLQQLRELNDLITQKKVGYHHLPYSKVRLLREA